MSKDDRLSNTGLEALRQRFQDQSRIAQAYYAVMHRAREAMDSEEAASAWMEAPLPEFDGKSPARLVAEGRVDDLLAYLDARKPALRSKA